MKRKVLSGVLASTLFMTALPSITLGNTEVTSSSEILSEQKQLEEVFVHLQEEQIEQLEEANINVTIAESTEQLPEDEPAMIIVEELEGYDEAYFENVDLTSLATNREYIELDINEEDLVMYIEIQDYIQKNEDSTVIETIQHFYKEFGNETTLFGLVANAGYKETYAQWTALTTQEKILVASDPVAAALTKQLKQKHLNILKLNMEKMV